MQCRILVLHREHNPSALLLDHSPSREKGWNNFKGAKQGRSIFKEDTENSFTQNICESILNSKFIICVINCSSSKAFYFHPPNWILAEKSFEFRVYSKVISLPQLQRTVPQCTEQQGREKHPSEIVGLTHGTAKLKAASQVPRHECRQLHVLLELLEKSCRWERLSSAYDLWVIHRE